MRSTDEIRRDIARVPRKGEPMPDKSFHGWVGVACRLRDDAEALLAEVERLKKALSDRAGASTDPTLVTVSMPLSLAGWPSPDCTCPELYTKDLDCPVHSRPSPAVLPEKEQQG